MILSNKKISPVKFLWGLMVECMLSFLVVWKLRNGGIILKAINLCAMNNMKMPIVLGNWEMANQVKNAYEKDHCSFNSYFAIAEKEV